MSEEKQQKQPIQLPEKNTVKTPAPLASPIQPVQHAKRHLKQGGENIREA